MHTSKKNLRINWCFGDNGFEKSQAFAFESKFVYLFTYLFLI